uniref:Uncharacterized protein n=1 Tax=Oryza glumipatula TaxID=40148 RepID=A0A0E0BIB1_9ORYZ
MASGARLVSATATSSQSGGSIVPSPGTNLPFPASGAAGLGGGRSGALGPRRGGSAAPTLGATVLGSGDDDVEWHGTGKVAKSDAYSRLSASIAIVTTLSSCFLPPTLGLQVADDDRDATESMETTTSAGVRMWWLRELLPATSSSRVTTIVGVCLRLPPCAGVRRRRPRRSYAVVEEAHAGGG